MEEKVRDVERKINNLLQVMMSDEERPRFSLDREIRKKLDREAKEVVNQIKSVTIYAAREGVDKNTLDVLLTLKKFVRLGNDAWLSSYPSIGDSVKKHVNEFVQICQSVIRKSAELRLESLGKDDGDAVTDKIHEECGRLNDPLKKFGILANHTNSLEIARLFGDLQKSHQVEDIHPKCQTLVERIRNDLEEMKRSAASFRNYEVFKAAEQTYGVVGVFRPMVELFLAEGALKRARQLTKLASKLVREAEDPTIHATLVSIKTELMAIPGDVDALFKHLSNAHVTSDQSVKNFNNLMEVMINAYKALEKMVDDLIA